MTLTLSPGISFCEVDGGRLFLDVRNDRYFCLGPPADVAVTALLRGTVSDEQRVRLDALIAANILVDQPHGECPRPCPPSPLTGSLLEQNLARPRVAAVATTACAIQWAKFELRRSSLATICARLAALKEHRSANLRRGRTEELARIASAFAASAQLVGTLDQCLACSLAVVRRCLAKDIAATLVIGVTRVGQRR